MTMEKQDRISMARKELAKRELARRQQESQPFVEPEEEGFINKLPRNILAGLASLGHTTLNAPHDIAQALESSGGNIGETINKGLPLPKQFQEHLNQLQKHKPFLLSEQIPFQQEHNFAQLLGQSGEGTLMDKLIQKGVEYAPEIASGRALLRAGLRRYPITQHMAGRQLREADRLINELGAQVPISEELINASRPFLPRGHATTEMIHGAESGHYPSSFSMQSQLGQHQRNLSNSILPADRLIAPELGDIRRNVINHMENSLRSRAHLDPRYNEAADYLRGGLNDYRRYVHFRDRFWPLAKKIGIPTTALALAAFGLTKGKKMLSDLVD